MSASACEKDFNLRYFEADNLAQLWQKLKNELGWQRPQIKDSLMGDAFFCTWTQYPRAINQERILEMAQEIRQYDYPCSTIVIDDRWESCFGELEFGKDFPEPQKMLQQLQLQG